MKILIILALGPVARESLRFEQFSAAGCLEV